MLILQQNKMNKLRDAASFLKTKFQTDQLDQKLAEAVSQQNWQASTQLLHQIANASYNFQKEQKIIAFIYEKIKNKSWKKILKTLHLVDFLLKYGPTTLIDNLKENIYEFRQLDDFKHHSQGIDRGQSIRKQSKTIVTLLSDDHLLNEERAKAKQIKDRMATVIGSGAYYGNFSSDTKTSGPNYDNKNVGGYTSFSSDSYKYTGSFSGGNSLSFGQSVMKELQDKKKKQQPVQEKKPNPTKLNLSSMNERKAQKKAEDQKPNFSNLSQKLVKPPEKKATVQTKIQANTNLQKPNIQSPEKPQQKAANNFDIMDLDFNAMGVNQPTKTNQVQSFDFLGTPQIQKTQTFNYLQPKKTQSAPPVTSQHQVVQNNFLLGQINSSFNNSIPQKPQPQPNFTPVQPPAYPQQYQYNNNLGGLNGFSLGNYQNNVNATTTFNPASVSKPQVSNNLALNLNTIQKKQNKPSDSLIDFSNFREELNNISAKDKTESITTNWNW